MRHRYKARNAKPSRKELQNCSIQLPPEKVERLLYQLCVELGFCLGPKVNKRLAHSPPKNPQRFAEVVMTAEGLSPLDSDLYDKVFACVYKTFLAERPDDDGP